MIRRTTDLSATTRAGFDAIIDVRSPSEFALDHMPGAINLPVLDDAQRVAVGTEYVQRSKFLARRHGAAMVARNIAAHLEGPLLWNPAGVPIDDVLTHLGIVEGTVAVTGGPGLRPIRAALRPLRAVGSPGPVAPRWHPLL